MARANKLVDLECELTNKARAEQEMFVRPIMAGENGRGSRAINIRNCPAAIGKAPTSPKRPPLSGIDNLSPKGLESLVSAIVQYEHIIMKTFEGFYLMEILFTFR